MSVRILFVDAAVDVLADLRRALSPQRDGWEMHFVPSASAAWRILEVEPFDVVVADLSVPGVDGVPFLSEVRQRYPEAARLVLSDHTSGEGLMPAVLTAHQFLAKPFESEDVIAAVERSLRLRAEIDQDWLRADVAGLDALPSPRAVLYELLAVLDSPRSTARDVAAVVERDVGLATKVLQLVNSSFFAPRSRITSLDRAIAHLGIGTVRSVVLSDEVMRTFRMPGGDLGAWLTRVNAHALQTATLARRLAAPEDRDDAFCAGLLHECGQLVFAACRPGLFLAHLTLRAREGRPLVDIERESFGVTHAEAGARLLSLWGFRGGVVDAVEAHCHPPAVGSAGPGQAATAVAVAHRLVEAEVMRLCTAPDDPGLSDAWLDGVGLLRPVQDWRASTRVATAS
ncbi:MAG TPA: response regulator [Acidimicrobiia bacterium]|nr:response regulator [Acidimicrobiia bacterium]